MIFMNELNIELIQVWNDEEMEFYRADLTLIYPDDNGKKCRNKSI